MPPVETKPVVVEPVVEPLPPVPDPFADVARDDAAIAAAKARR